jgi:hypothetical protein
VWGCFSWNGLDHLVIKLNSVVLVRKRTIPTKRPQPADEVSANFSHLVILHGNINTEGYKDIMNRCVLSMVEDQFGDDDCLYEHHNAPCHKARSVREWFMDNKVPEMDWPAHSPDLNPTENLWDELECRLRSRPQCPTSLTALATALQEEWAAIPPEMFRQVTESHPGTVRTVIKAKGEPTRY